jgi:undecaprenyl phosphate-alpha-L-ara4N flippase subunit ArnE
VNAMLAVWFALSIGCDVGGQVCFEMGADRPAAKSSLVELLRAILSSPWLLAGIAIYTAEVFVWLKIFSAVPPSFAFLIASLNILGVIFASAAVLREKAGLRQWAGSFLVTIGVVMMAGTTSDNPIPKTTSLL